MDGSVQAIAAAPVARALAELDHATLRFVHVSEQTISARALLELVGLPSEQLRYSVIELARGTPAAGIVHLARASQEAPIVMCPRTTRAEPAEGLGTVAQAVLRDAPGPVVLVPPHRGFSPWWPRRILVPLDGTPAAAAALGSALKLARRSRAELDVLHVAVPTAVRPNAPGTVAVPAYIDQPAHEWPQWAREFLDRAHGLCRHAPAARSRLFMRVGTPAAEILRFASARRGDLIVLAWHGDLNSERASTLKEVVRGADCPVVVYRASNTG
ncbi:MAG: universal stress protein [Chloroflexota bacterium]|nr:universal stress protein [Chloroflexota bacterium]